MCYSIPTGYEMGTDGVMHYTGPVFEHPLDRFYKQIQPRPWYNKDTRVWHNCPRCGSLVKPRDSFCSKCGIAL